jgi:hypothetical protein
MNGVAAWPEYVAFADTTRVVAPRDTRRTVPLLWRLEWQRYNT